MTQTIYALASGAGQGGIAVIRISGPDTARTLQTLTGQPIPAPRYATRARFRSSDGEILDDGLVLWFPAPASFTGEDVAELHIHGGRAVIAALSEALSSTGLRLAEPGEFSKRAFLNRKMDLTQAEGIADLVAAETAAQRRQALRQMDGALGRLYEGWRERLVRLLAYSEALIDFSDEDLPEETATVLEREAAGLCDEISKHLNDSHRGERVRDGLEIAIIGAPNTGKSSLLNVLAGREAAIVSARAGTTRDVIEIHMDLGGYPVIIADTAGLRESTDEIEQEGIRRARARAEAADLVLALFDSTQAPRLDPHTYDKITEETLVIFSKSDLVETVSIPHELHDAAPYVVSTVTGAGLETFLEALGREVERRLQGGDTPALTRQRHRDSLTECLNALERARQAPLPELAGEDFRLAMRALGRITGRVDVEDLLDVIFRDFCIGK